MHVNWLEMSQSMMMAFWSAVLLLIGTELVNCDQWPFPDGEEYTLAHINVSYIDSAAVHNDAAEMGKFGNGRVGQTAGILVHVRSANSSSHYGCDIVYENEIPVIINMCGHCVCVCVFSSPENQ